MTLSLEQITVTAVEAKVEAAKARAEAAEAKANADKARAEAAEAKIKADKTAELVEQLLSRLASRDTTRVTVIERQVDRLHQALSNMKEVLRYEVLNRIMQGKERFSILQLVLVDDDMICLF